MSLFTPPERTFTRAVIDVLASNPFDPGFVARFREVMGEGAGPPGSVLAWQPGWGVWGPTDPRPGGSVMRDRLAVTGDRARDTLAAGDAADAADLELFEALSIYRLYRTVGLEFDRVIDAAVRDPRADPGAGVRGVWDEFRREHARLLKVGRHRFPLGLAPAHLFACFFLLRRAFYHLFNDVIGLSGPVARLRAAVWDSVITHDVREWSRTLAVRMRDFPTLITGPSGTGKEVVARAVGRSQYLPFDPAAGAFAADFRAEFHPVNLAALPAQLIESELFGHARGAFTGAVEKRVGRLEACSRYGVVFLDEVGELAQEVQVKLLRVLQDRRFQPVGENRVREFAGKVAAATNRDLAAEVRAGRFREDLYYRVCADRIETPSLREQLADRPDDLPLLVGYVSRQVVGDEAAADRLTARVVDLIRRDPRLGDDYPWPGNFRELEQCVRSYTVRRAYRPLGPSAAPVAAADPAADPTGEACGVLARAVLAGRLSFDEVERRVFALVRERAGSNQAAGRALGRDPRTVRDRLR
jgi:DNA-binding NtrC family response regulator